MSRHQIAYLSLAFIAGILCCAVGLVITNTPLERPTEYIFHWKGEELTAKQLETLLNNKDNAFGAMRDWLQELREKCDAQNDEIVLLKAELRRLTRPRDEV